MPEHSFAPIEGSLNDSPLIGLLNNRQETRPKRGYRSYPRQELELIEQVENYR